MTRNRVVRTLATSGLLAALVTLLSSGVADAKLASNHNETLLRVPSYASFVWSPAANAQNYLADFKGRCAATGGPSYLTQYPLDLHRGAYVEVPVKCTGTMRGVPVASRPMVLTLISWPSVVICNRTSIGHGGALLTTQGGMGALTDRGVMSVNNKTRKVSYYGERVAWNRVVGAVVATFTFPKPTTPSCQAKKGLVTEGVRGSITIG